MYHFAFVVEQVLGHITHGDNLRRHVRNDPDVDAHWVFAPYAVDGIAERVPVYRSNWTVRVGWRSRQMLREVRREVDLDAIFFHTQVPALLCHDLVRQIPSVISLDATPGQFDELGDHYAHERQPDAVEKMKLRSAQASFGAARQLVTWSTWAKEGLVDDYGVPADKVTVIPPGVSVAEWLRPHPRRSDPEAPTKILFVGGDLKRKGGSLLIEAFRALQDRDVVLHLVTRDAVAPEPGIVVHHGLKANSPELVALYHECDIFALPTYGDCLPMVLSEAGASSMATVSTAVAAIPEVVIDGETGLLTQPGDLQGLIEALRRLIDRPEERIAMGERAAEHIAAHYDTAANTSRLVALLKHVADTNRGVFR